MDVRDCCFKWQVLGRNTLFITVVGPQYEMQIILIVCIFCLDYILLVLKLCPYAKYRIVNSV